MKKLAFILVLLSIGVYGFAQQENISEDIETLKEMVKQGSHEAMGKLGYCYLTGTNVEKNDKEAFKLLNNASKSGDAFSNFYVGKCHYEGIGTPKKIF